LLDALAPLLGLVTKDLDDVVVAQRPAELDASVLSGCHHHSHCLDAAIVARPHAVAHGSFNPVEEGHG
jgi:hypothetical protein